MALELVRKMKLVVQDATLEVVVANQGGPLSSAAEVDSKGPDDCTLSDAQLTPGSGWNPLDAKNCYGRLWIDQGRGDHVVQTWR